jgi:dynamin 1-like protein
MLQEPNEIAVKRKRCRELFRAYQQAFRDLDELPLEAETVEWGHSSPETTSLPKLRGLPTSSMYSTSSLGDNI